MNARPGTNRCWFHSLMKLAVCSTRSVTHCFCTSTTTPLTLCFQSWKTR